MKNLPQDKVIAPLNEQAYQIGATHGGFVKLLISSHIANKKEIFGICTGATLYFSISILKNYFSSFEKSFNAASDAIVRKDRRVSYADYYNVLALLQGFSMLQIPEKYNFLLHPNYFPTDLPGSVNIIAKLLHPHNDTDSDIYFGDSIFDIYRMDEMQDFFDKLKSFLTTRISGLPFSFLIFIPLHMMSFSYDPHEDEWLYFDLNFKIPIVHHMKDNDFSDLLYKSISEVLKCLPVSEGSQRSLLKEDLRVPIKIQILMNRSGLVDKTLYYFNRHLKIKTIKNNHVDEVIATFTSNHDLAKQVFLLANANGAEHIIAKRMLLLHQFLPKDDYQFFAGPLHNAIQRNDLDIVKHLLSQPSVNFKAEYQEMTPLQYARHLHYDNIAALIAEKMEEQQWEHNPLKKIVSFFRGSAVTPISPASPAPRP